MYIFYSLWKINRNCNLCIFRTLYSIVECNTLLVVWKHLYDYWKKQETCLSQINDSNLTLYLVNLTPSGLDVLANAIHTSLLHIKHAMHVLKRYLCTAATCHVCPVRSADQSRRLQAQAPTPEALLLREACYRALGEGFGHPALASRVDFAAWYSSELRGLLAVPPCVPLHFAHSGAPVIVVATPGSASAAFAGLRAEPAEAASRLRLPSILSRTSCQRDSHAGRAIPGQADLSIPFTRFAVLLCCAKSSRLPTGAGSPGGRPAECARGAAARARALARGHLRHGPAAGAVRGRAVSPGRPSELRGPGRRARGRAGGRRAGHAPHDRRQRARPKLSAQCQCKPSGDMSLWLMLAVLITKATTEHRACPVGCGGVLSILKTILRQRLHMSVCMHRLIR